MLKSKQNGALVTRAADGADVELVTSIDHEYPSSVYNRYLTVQHLTSMYPELLTTEEIVSLLRDLSECYTYSTFPSSVVRHVIVSIHQLVLMEIAKRTEIVTKELLDKVVRFFANDSFKDFLDANRENGKLCCLGYSFCIGFVLNFLSFHHF